MLKCDLMKDGRCVCTMECAKAKAYRQSRQDTLNECWSNYDKMGRGAFESWIKEEIKNGSKN